MKNVVSIFVLLLIFIRINAQTSQIQFNSTTIDSFKITVPGFYYGVTGLDAVKSDNFIHLSYLYTKNSEPPVLKYILTDGSVYFSENIANLEVPYKGYSSILLDENKNPWVFLSFNYKIICYKRTPMGWTTTQIDTLENIPFISCIKNSSDDLGVFYWLINYQSGTWELRHNYWDGNTWVKECVYKENGHTGGIISAISFNSIPYIATTYVIPPDSTFCSIFFKYNNNWVKEFTYFVGNGYSNIGDQSIIGISNDGRLHLWQKPMGSYSNYYIKVASEWQKESSAQSGMGSFFRSDNLYFSNENYTFSISSHAGFFPTVNWRSDEGEYGSSEIPYHGYPYGVGLLDFLITSNNYGHIFLVSGGVPGQYGDSTAFITFKELTFNTSEVVTVINDEANIEFEYKLIQNYPNPFNPTTTITYSIPTPPISLPLVRGGTEGGVITLKVYDILGREIATLVNEKQSPGKYKVVFDGKDLSSGVYFYQLITNNFSQTRKMILIK